MQKQRPWTVRGLGRDQTQTYKKKPQRETRQRQTKTYKEEWPGRSRQAGD